MFDCNGFRRSRRPPLLSLSLSLSLSPQLPHGPTDRRRLSLSFSPSASVGRGRSCDSVDWTLDSSFRQRDFIQSIVGARARTQHRPGRRILTFELTLCAASNRERASRSRSPFPYFWARLREFRSPRPEGAGRRDSLNLPIALGLLLPICS